MPCQQETPSWLSRSSNGISFSPWRSRESPQTHARNLSSPSILSSPSSCPRPSLKFNGNEPPWPTDAPLTCFLSDMYMQLLTQDKTLDKHLTEDFFCLNENKFYLLYFLVFLPVNVGFQSLSFVWQLCYGGFTFAYSWKYSYAYIRLFLSLHCSNEIAVLYFQFYRKMHISIRLYSRLDPYIHRD